jgi:rhamnose transport system substrate-binding protein
MVQLRRVAVLATALTVGLTAACSSTTKKASDTGSPTATGVKKGLTVYFIPKDTQNP